MRELGNKKFEVIFNFFLTHSIQNAKIESKSNRKFDAIYRNNVWLFAFYFGLADKYVRNFENDILSRFSREN